MTTPTIRARHFAACGYVPAGPIAATLRSWFDAGVIEYRLAKHLGVGAATLTHIRHGTTKFVHPDIAEAIRALDDATALEMFSRPANPTADGAVVRAILAGEDVDVPPDLKRVYALALHTHGWPKSRIARYLTMSGTSINRILGAAA